MDLALDENEVNRIVDQVAEWHEAKNNYLKNEMSLPCLRKTGFVGSSSLGS